MHDKSNDTITNGDRSCTKIQEPILPYNPDIKYLGVLLNMDLNWTTQTNKLASKVGLLLHTINSNNLTLEAAV